MSGKKDLPVHILITDDNQLVREFGEVVPDPRPASDGVAPAATSIAR